MTDLELAKVALTTHVRDLIREAFVSTADQAKFEAATRKVEEALRLVFTSEPDDVSPTQRQFLDRSPFMGAMNPLAPPVTVQIIDGEPRSVEARVTFTAPYEGPPGHVHGGLIAAVFDEILGFAQSLSGRPGMTGNLSINYRKPTPLNTELIFRGHITSIDGRKIFTTGTLHAGDTLCCEATGIFVSMKADTMARLFRDRELSLLQKITEQGDGQSPST
jgi:acyl-coenzyme A thioesterase PaaI-like protein